MSCSINRCNMFVGGSGNQARVLPHAESTPYPEGAGSASEAAKMNGNENTNSQLQMSNAFKGGSGGRIVVAQPTNVTQSQSGSQSANNTTTGLAVSLTQGNENASMDKLVGGRRRRTRRNKKSKNRRKSRKSNKTRKSRKMKKSKKRRKTRKSRKMKKKLKGGNVDADPSKIAEYIEGSARWRGENKEPNQKKAISIIKQPNFNPNQMSAKGEPLIHLAYKADNKTILEMLIENPELDNKNAEDVLRKAIARNDDYIINLFKKNNKVPKHLKKLV